MNLAARLFEAQRMRFLAVVVGFALTWFFFRPGALSILFAPWDPTLEFYSSWYMALLALLVSLSIVVPLCPPMRRILFSNPYVSFAVIECTAVGYLLLYTARYVAFSQVAATVAMLIVALGYVVLIYGWYDVLSGMEEGGSAKALAASAIVYAVIEGVGSEYDKTMLYVLAPCISGLLLILVSVNRRVSADDLKSFETQCGMREALNTVQSIPRVDVLLAALFLVFLVCGRIVIGLTFNLEHTLPAGVMFVRTLLITLIALALIAFSVKTGTSDGFLARSWAPVALVFFAGQLLLIAFGESQEHMGTAITSAALMGFELLSFVLVVNLSRAAGFSRTAVFALGLVILRLLPLIVQRAVVPHAVEVYGLTHATSLYVSMLAVLVVISGMFMFFIRLSEWRVPTTQESHAREDYALLRRGVCALMGAEVGLTAREVEILGLLSEGNSQKKIADELTISHGTVQWYAKSVYRKLDVHSKQELIDLVAQRMEAENSRRS